MVSGRFSLPNAAPRPNFSAPIAALVALLLAACGQEVGTIGSGWRVADTDRAFTGIRTPGRPVDLGRDLRPQLGLAPGPVSVTLVRDLKAGELHPPAGIVAVDWDGLFEISRVSFNGHDLGGVGSLVPYLPEPDHHLITVIPAELVRPLGTNEIRLVLSARGPQLRVRGPLRIGAVPDIVRSLRVRTGLACALVALYFGIGAYHLLLAFRRRRDRHNLFFGLFSIAYGVFWTANTETRELLYRNSLAASLSDQVSLFLLLPLFLLFVSHLFQNRNSRVGLAYGLLSGALIATALLGDSHIRYFCLQVWMYTAVLALGYIVFFIVREVLKKRVEAVYLLVGVLVMVIGALHDILVQEGVVRGQFLSAFSFLFFVLGVAGVLADRFVRVHNQAEDLNRDLEVRVVERTRQVQETLAEVQELKNAQDGDYYLTSLLLKPLAQSDVPAGSVGVESFLSQKKKFHFRQWTAEIGGDLTSASTITLRGRPYTVFVNADAMGKSMQGAGGALVLGTVFKANVTRTQFSARQQEKHPEFWLRDCYYELQNVFVSFEGSMLSSAVLGLVSEDGLLYLVNAEHPATVRLRDGRAAFIDGERQVRKIGIAESEKELQVLALRLRPNDVLFFGSDGRDDLQLGIRRDGSRRINEDESRFLRLIEEAEGDLPRLVRLIYGSGEITDDLSLMRITYREDGPLDAEESLSPARFRREYRELAESNRFALALELCRTVTEQRPEWDEFLFYAAYTARRVGDLELAREFGERCRLVRRDLAPNLKNLATVYELLERPERVAAIQEQLRAMAAAGSTE